MTPMYMVLEFLFMPVSLPSTKHTNLSVELDSRNDKAFRSTHLRRKRQSQAHGPDETRTPRREREATTAGGAKIHGALTASPYLPHPALVYPGLLLVSFFLSLPTYYLPTVPYF